METYSHQFKDGVLFEVIEKQLKKANISLDPENKAKMWLKLNTSLSKEIISFKRLLKSSVEQMKCNRLSIEKLRFHNQNVRNPVEKRRNQLIIELVEDIYVNYSKALTGSKHIDFNDMILNSYHLIDSNTIKRNYKYIIVDEYQDISQVVTRRIETCPNDKLFSLEIEYKRQFKNWTTRFYLLNDTLL